MGLIVCFFLPFCRGCDNAPFVPAEAAFKNPAAFLFAGTPFLYPLILLMGWVLVKKSPRLVKTLYILNLVLISGLSAVILYFTFFEKSSGKTPDLREILAGIALMVLVIGSIATFQLKKVNLLLAVAFQQSALSLIWIGTNIFWNNDILYGGWMSLGFALTATVLACPLL